MDNNSFDTYPRSLNRFEIKTRWHYCSISSCNLDEGENVFVEMPFGLQMKGKVLKPKKTLYGLCQAFHAFWKYLVEKLEACGMSQSKVDPCLFIWENVTCIYYVDDLLFWSKDEAHINELAILLCCSGVDLEQEDDAAGFLGVQIKHNESGLLEMEQEGLIDYVI